MREEFRETTWKVVHHFKTSKNAKKLLASNAISPPTKTLILMHNSMFGMPLSFDESQIPAGCAFTTNRKYWQEATAVVFHIPTLRRLQALQRYPGKLKVGWFMESGVQYPVLKNRQIVHQFGITMSFRRHVDIWAPYRFPDFSKLKHRHLKPKSKDHLIALFFSYSGELSGRNRYAQELMHYIDMHSYGKFLRNRSLLNDSGRKTKLDVLSGYKFNLAFENSIEEDYVTEKFFDPLEAGCVPVYMGAPNIDDYAPGEHSYINASDFNNPEELAEYLLALNEDDKAYNVYHAWRSQPLRPQYCKVLEKQRIDPFVQLCKLIQSQGQQFNSEIRA